MKVSSFFFILASFAIVFVSGCDNKKEELELESPNAYFISLKPGKYITYRLDSTVFVQAGRQEEIHSYREKHVVDAEITDALGRKSFRIFRYLNNTTGTSNWLPAGSYSITPGTNSVEVIEDNLRIVALAGPLKEGQTWKGNRFLGKDPYGSLYTFSNDDNINDWVFEIKEKDVTLNLNGKSYTQVLTVKGPDESVNVPIQDTKSYASRIQSLTQYSKNIGMVNQVYILWEYQPNPNGTPYQTGFGIKRTIIDHN
jgi:hypothetical protein